MSTEKKYFIHLLSCFLNNKNPEMPDSVDWQKIYALADVHDVEAIIAQEIKALPPELCPKAELKSRFNQHIGHTIRAFDTRNDVRAKLDSFLCKNQIDHIFVKGSMIDQYYPVPEFRTSGDIDVIIRYGDAKKLIELLKNRGLSFNCNTDVIILNINGLKVEIHTNSNVESSYFEDIFSVANPCGNYGFELNQYNHLLYVLCHLCHHLRYMGAGIRMVMDIDVLVRSIADFDEDGFALKCREAGVEKSWEVVSSLSKLWFDTPIAAKVDYSREKELYSMLKKIILDGGTFGFENYDLSDYYIAQNLGDDKNVSNITRLKALVTMFFPEQRIIRSYYPYVEKSKFLLPVAYVQRIFEAVFKRFGHSVKTIKNIAGNQKEISVVQIDLLRELDIYE